MSSQSPTRGLFAFRNRLVLLSLFAGSQLATAGPCPRLEGTFRCRSPHAFELSITNSAENGVAIYTVTDPTGTKTFISDESPHRLQFSGGEGSYLARCENNQLVLEAQTPSGEILSDKYFIERAALVRVRTSPHRSPEVLSCGPTNGTWNLYPH